MKSLLEHLSYIKISAPTTSLFLVVCSHILFTYTELKQVTQSTNEMASRLSSEFYSALKNQNVIALRKTLRLIENEKIESIALESPSFFVPNKFNLLVGDPLHKHVLTISSEISLAFRGTKLGKLTYHVDLLGLSNSLLIKNLLVYFFLFLVFFTMVVTTTLRPISTIKSIDQLLVDTWSNSKTTNRPLETVVPKSIQESYFSRRYSKLINQLLQTFKRLTIAELEISKIRGEQEFARRIAHDIRSPLSALTILAKNSDELPEEKRTMLVAASNRISSIANEILDRSKTTKHKYAMIDQILPSIIAEKELEYENTRISFDWNSDYGVFCNADPDKIKSILSNLINNSVEANASSIRISVQNTADTFLTVKDDGVGISSSNLKKLGNEEFSTKIHGNGIGLKSAIQLVNSWGGAIKIGSKVGEGTTIGIQLKNVASPKWYLASLDLLGYKYVIVCDDDPSIHLLFDQNCQPQLIHFYSLNDFLKKKNQYPNSLVFMDNSFRGEAVKGIDTVDENVILMSAEHSDELLKEVVKKGSKFIPKTCLYNPSFWNSIFA